MTTEQLLAKREKLLQMALSGVLESDFEDSHLKYRSMAELRDALKLIDEEITGASPTTRRRITQVVTGKGY